MSLSVKYDTPWRVRFSPPQSGQPNIPSNSSSIVVQIPSLRLLADIPFVDKLIQALKDNGFANDADNLRQLDYTLTSFEYPLQMIVDQSKNLLRLAVQNEDSYLSKDMSKGPDIVLDIIDQLRNKHEFAGATLSLKRDLLVKAVITSIINQSLAKKLRDAEITLRNPVDKSMLVAQNVTLSEKSIQLLFTGKWGDIHPQQGLAMKDEVRERSLHKGTIVNLQEPVSPTSTSISNEDLENLGIINVIGAQSDEGIARVQNASQNHGYKCNMSGHISLPISEDSATIANYLTCYKGTTSVEYRFHTEKASLVNASPEGPIIYANIRYHRPLTKDFQPTQIDGGVPTFAALLTALDKSSSDAVKDGFFVTHWSNADMNISVLGFCSNMQADTTTCDNSKRIITDVRLWRN